MVAFLAERGLPAPIGAETGLGLWVARRMATELGGTLVAERSSLGGAHLRITIPLRGEARELADVA
jgi:signal transduction histidine kinase